VEADLLNAPDLASIAHAFGHSTRSLQRRLTEHGLSLQSIRRAAQIKKASAMLIETDASLFAIGFACGFTDQPHFARAFAKAAGMSPKAFREAARPESKAAPKE
jgi:AraC family carnitine catabolism transcriptional activator